MAISRQLSRLLTQLRPTTKSITGWQFTSSGNWQLSSSGTKYLIQHQSRQSSSSSTPPPSSPKPVPFALQYAAYGDPLEVLSLVDNSAILSAKLEPNQVLVSMLACPLNPADINTIQGTYAIKPKLPAIGGNEGVGQVVKLGSGVKKLKEGDWVIPAQGGVGTWRSHLITGEDDLLLVDKELDWMCAAQLSVNPCTAYRMLKDFVNLKQGDTVIQNGANSAVGLNVIQLCREWRVNTINVVRQRPDLDELKSNLTKLGATHVIVEEDLRNKELMDKIINKSDGLRAPKLALNCVGGKNATDCMRHLDNKGTMVTYGGMSKQPLIVPTGSLIFKDQKFHGYWMTRWSKENAGSEERQKMIEYLCAQMKSGKLLPPKSVPVKIENYKEAISDTMSGFANAKMVFVFN